MKLKNAAGRSVLIMMALLFMSPMTSYGKEKKPTPFYDSKSWIVNVAGYPELDYFDLKSKFNKIDLNVPVLSNPISSETDGQRAAEMLTRQGVGKAMIDKITANGTSDEYLKKLALKNAQRADYELGAASILGDNDTQVRTLVADDYEPILTHNYIITYNTFTWTDKNGTHTGKTYHVFKVDIDKEKAFDIVNTITDPARYNLIDMPVKYLYTIKSTIDAENELAKYVPDMALRGVLLHRNPCRISIGENAGLNKGDLVSFYSQRMDKNGKMYSKRISRARVCGLWDNEAQVNYEAGLAGNRKNGDVVVRTPDNHLRFVLMANWQPHVWGGTVMGDAKMGFARSGVISHFLMDLGFNMTDKPGNSYYLVEDGYVNDQFKYKSPMYINFGLGYGFSKTFLGFFDVMPFFLVQYEGAFMFSDKKLDSNASSDDDKMPFGSSLRVPIGLRFSVNMGYPTRFFVEAGYSVRVGFGDDFKIIEQAEKYIGAKRKGPFLNVGFCF